MPLTPGEERVGADSAAFSWSCTDGQNPGSVCSKTCVGPYKKTGKRWREGHFECVCADECKWIRSVTGSGGNLTKHLVFVCCFFLGARNQIFKFCPARPQKNLKEKYSKFLNSGFLVVWIVFFTDYGKDWKRLIRHVIYLNNCQHRSRFQS